MAFVALLLPVVSYLKNTFQPVNGVQVAVHLNCSLSGPDSDGQATPNEQTTGSEGVPVVVFWAKVTAQVAH